MWTPEHRSGTLERIHHALYVAVREQVGRWSKPDSGDHPAKGATKKGAFSRSFGLRRGQEGQGSQAAHPGRHAGSPAERRRSFRRYSGPSWCHPLAASSATICSPLSSASLPMAVIKVKRWSRLVSRTGLWKLEIVKRSTAAGFEVLPKRWIVERTFAWISRNRRLARDFERYATTAAAFIRLAMIRIMLRRLAANLSS